MNALTTARSSLNVPIAIEMKNDITEGVRVKNTIHKYRVQWPNAVIGRFIDDLETFQDAILLKNRKKWGIPLKYISYRIRIEQTKRGSGKLFSCTHIPKPLCMYFMLN